MLDLFAGFDILGVAAALGGLALLGWLIWALVAGQDLEELNDRHRDASAPASTRDRVGTAPPAAAAGVKGSGDGKPLGPNRRGRAA